MPSSFPKPDHYTTDPENGGVFAVSDCLAGGKPGPRLYPRWKGSGMDERFVVESGPRAPRAARAHLARLLAGVSDEVLEGVRLATTELVTNVVRHAGVSEGDPIEVRVQQMPDRLTITVEQPTDAPLELPAHYEPSVDGGMGLAIVEKISDRWGAEAGPPGHVWFEMSR